MEIKWKILNLDQFKLKSFVIELRAKIIKLQEKKLQMLCGGNETLLLDTV